MKLYILLKADNGLYEVYCNGVKVKNAIYTDPSDFEKELEALGISGQIVVGI